MTLDVQATAQVREQTIRKLPEIPQKKAAGWAELEVDVLKPPVSSAALDHKDILQGEFWRHIPAYQDVDQEMFLDHAWQSRNSVTSPQRLRSALGSLASEAFFEDVEKGFQRAPMSMRISPYVIALIDWNDPYNCPLRAQFVPVEKKLLEDHPKLHLDTLHEQADSPTPGLTHRYSDKALFLPIDTCPVYCRFCTRSYAVGADTDEVAKVGFRVNHERWQAAFAYVASRPELEDIVISGGDSYNLRPEQIEAIGLTLLSIPHVRRIRFATKGLAIMPQKILSHPEWVEAVTRVVDNGRRKHKDVAIHTHFNHPKEVTWITQKAMGKLHERGIIVRNQAVLQRGVNDDATTMIKLVRRLGYLNIHPYYVYVCDLVQGIEDLRTSLATALRLEKHVRGSTAGFNTPTFVCDLPGGGGKRSAHSYEYYNRDTGIAVYSAPSVKPGLFFMYFDPLHALSEEYRRRWKDEKHQTRMIKEALHKARARLSI
jgi:lysine 2,3-aminomutase